MFWPSAFFLINWKYFFHIIYSVYHFPFHIFYEILPTSPKSGATIYNQRPARLKNAQTRQYETNKQTNKNLQKFHWVHFVLASPAGMGLPLPVFCIPSESPFAKTIFFLCKWSSVELGMGSWPLLPLSVGTPSGLLSFSAEYIPEPCWPSAFNKWINPSNWMYRTRSHTSRSSCKSRKLGKCLPLQGLLRAADKSPGRGQRSQLDWTSSGSLAVRTGRVRERREGPGCVPSPPASSRQLFEKPPFFFSKEQYEPNRHKEVSLSGCPLPSAAHLKASALLIPFLLQGVLLYVLTQPPSLSKG